jgi:hypothetical protein
MKALLFALTLAACGSKKPATAEAPTTEAPAAGHEQGSATSLTAQQCTDQGGEVVGDIGDGATSQPDYKCAKSGLPPIGHIAAEPGKPMAIEGAVCCK